MVTQLTVVTTASEPASEPASQLQPLADDFRQPITVDYFFFKGKVCERLGFKDLSTCMCITSGGRRRDIHA
jgi:hypothetical protein